MVTNILIWLIISQYYNKDTFLQVRFIARIPLAEACSHGGDTDNSRRNSDMHNYY
jgi:hypothetical protein